VLYSQRRWPSSAENARSIPSQAPENTTPRDGHGRSGLAGPQWFTRRFRRGQRREPFPFASCAAKRNYAADLVEPWNTAYSAAAPVLNPRPLNRMIENGVSCFLTLCHFGCPGSGITQLLQSVPIRHATFDIEPGVRRES
jgi:hypothetical protein